MTETERIKIYPASREQMERTIQAEKDDELKKAYGEMLEGCLTHPDQWDWYAMWMIEKTDGTHIGDLCFKGLEEKNPEIGYGILDEFQGHGYATEAVSLAIKWAFEHPFNRSQRDKDSCKIWNKKRTPEFIRGVLFCSCRNPYPTP